MSGSVTQQTVATRLLCPWDSPGKNIEVGCHALLEDPSRGSSRPSDQTHTFYVSCIGRWVLYYQCHLGSPLSVYTAPQVCSPCVGQRKSCDPIQSLGKKATHPSGSMVSHHQLCWEQAVLSSDTTCMHVGAQ